MYASARSKGPCDHMDFDPKLRKNQTRYRNDYLFRVVNIFITLNEVTPQQGYTYVKSSGMGRTGKALAIEVRHKFMWYALDAGYAHGAFDNMTDEGRYMLVLMYSEKGLPKAIKDQLITADIPIQGDEYT